MLYRPLTARLCHERSTFSRRRTVVRIYRLCIELFLRVHGSAEKRCEVLLKTTLL